VPDTKLPAHVDDPGYWRARAEEVRAIADDMKHSRSKEIMLGIAEDYEKIAQITEARLQQKPQN